MLAVSAEPFVGSLALVPCVLGLAVVAGLTVLLVLLVRPVLAKTQAQDVPAALVGLSQIIASLSCLLPWGKWRPPAEGSPASASDREVVQPGRSASATTTIAEYLMVVRPCQPERDACVAQLSALSHEREGEVDGA